MTRLESIERVPSLHAQAVDWVRLHLTEELPPMPKTLLRQRAEQLVAIAEQADVAIETLLEWIHYRSEGKAWSAAEWQRWCEKFTHDRDELSRRQRSQAQRVCAQCAANALLQLGERWVCGKCGEVTQQ